LHAARDQGLALAQAMRSARIFGPRERLFEAAMRRVSAADCEQALRSTALADRIFKGVAAGDSWLTLERIVMRMAGVPLPGDN
ncbi:MAG: DNA polymerase III subunit delta, partial [Betaproteobacteria bacterium]